jgi:hypothetical protein
MAAVDQIATARNEEFAARTLFIATKVAQMVVAEDVATEDHAVRVNYAGRIIRGTDNPKMIATHVISSNPTIQAAIDESPELYGSNIPDGDIEFALSSIWTARAYAFEGIAG